MITFAIGIWVLTSRTQLKRTDRSHTDHRTNGSLLGISGYLTRWGWQLLVVCTTAGWVRLMMNGGSSGNYIPPQPTKEKLSAVHLCSCSSRRYARGVLGWRGSRPNTAEGLVSRWPGKMQQYMESWLWTSPSHALDLVVFPLPPPTRDPCN